MTLPQQESDRTRAWRIARDRLMHRAAQRLLAVTIQQLDQLRSCLLYTSCGHDAPIYSVIEQIVERSGTPFFSFKDMDENCPAHSIRMRVETIDYFLKRYQEDRLHGKRHG